MARACRSIARILAGVQKACYKRPVSAESIVKIVDSVEEEVSRTCQREVASHTIGEIVMKFLRRVDPIAFVRFASVYREFRDVRQLVDEAQDMVNRAKNHDPAQRDLFQ